MSVLRLLLFAWLILGPTGSLSDGRAAEPSKDPTDTASTPSPAAITPVLQALLQAAGPDDQRGGEPLDRPALLRFYASRNFDPAWTGSTEAGERATLLVAAFARAAEQGLNPSDYHLATLEGAARPSTPGAAAERDLLVTDAALRYAHDLRLGRVDPAQLDDQIGLPPRSFDPVDALLAALGAGQLSQLLADLPPPYPAYARLIDGLKRYRALLARGGWPAIPGGSELKLTGDDPRLAQLRRRLAAEDDSFADPDQASRSALDEALRRFQARHGLVPDSRIGARTLAALNTSATERVSQIIVNLERWRWMPRQIEPRHVVINSADGALQVIAAGRPVLGSRVVVGDQKHASPILRAVATEITVNPPWNVPPSIARKEMLPKLRRNLAYLLGEHIIIVNGPADDPYGLRIDWNEVSAGSFPYKLRQLPGPQNALGSLKFEMPNPFDIYLHDTPAKKLFAQAQRYFSHGCIRVERAFALASFALTGNTASAIPGLREKVEAGATRHIRLKEPLPVYLLYWTALADEDGRVEFRADVYGRDARLAAALAAHSGLDSLSFRVPAGSGHHA